MQPRDAVVDGGGCDDDGGDGGHARGGAMALTVPLSMPTSRDRNQVD